MQRRGTLFANKSARGFALSGLLLLGCFGIAPSVANADVFEITATVGDIFGSTTAGMYTGLTVTGQLDINTTTGALDTSDSNVMVQGDPNEFTGFFGCPSTCTYTFNSGFYEFGLLDIGNAIGFTGGSLVSDSYIALTDPLGSNNAEVQYYLSGSVGSAATPEPGFYAALALGMSGLAFAVWRRRRLA
jgi:hypothetical protein